MSSTILCIEEEPAAGAVLRNTLTQMGCRLMLVATIHAGIRTLAKHPVDLVITECRTREQTAVELLDHLRHVHRSTPVIVTTGYASIEHAVLMMRRGAADYLTKPLRAEGVRLAVRSVLEVDRLRRENQEMVREIAAVRSERTLVGQSVAIERLRQEIAAVAPTRATVLIEGESGTGKELVARAIHEQSPRRDRPFVTLNCAALPEGLVESALFGHERGAFTGAAARAQGAFERADGGTLLLDEISEMRIDLQAKLLRAIQEHEIERVGGQGPLPVDVRIVATTNRDLPTEVAAGRFREDLYFRLEVVPLRTPPLRARTEDVPLLLEHLLHRHAAHHGLPVPRVEPAALELLMAHTWPGNVREFSNVVERALIMSHGSTLGCALFERVLTARRGSPSAHSTTFRLDSGPEPDEAVFDLRTIERRTIEHALAATGGHRRHAAQLLGISERTLRSKLNASPVQP